MNKKRLMAIVMFVSTSFSSMAQNPFLPLWEYVPDGEPYVFEDPDKPGSFRVYIYGSHDSSTNEYCGREQVVWSAPVENLMQWRYDGIDFKSVYNANGRLLHPDGNGDMLYAPDVAVRKNKDGSKTYFLYPNNQEEGRQGMVCKSSRPDGPFEVINWSKDNPNKTDGLLRFDPAVLVDDDGRVYAYWGFNHSFGAELDPNTMATLKEGTKIVEDMIPSCKQDDKFRFFEASSMRKIEDKYVFVYSRVTRSGENGLPASNYTLAYAYGDNPLGPFTYGGTIIDGRAREKDPQTGVIKPTATSGGNTHGSIFNAGGQWWVVFHRQTGLNEFSRQAMAAPINVKVEKGRGGKVYISEAEYTSEGFAVEGLDPLRRTAAGTACYYTGPTVSENHFPNFKHSGPYMHPTRLGTQSTEELLGNNVPYTPVVNTTDGSVLGYKYFNFALFGQRKTGRLLMNVFPHGVAGTITVMVGSPYERQGGIVIGKINISSNAPQSLTEINIPVSRLNEKKGKQGLYFCFTAEQEGKSLCDIYDFVFE